MWPSEKWKEEQVEDVPKHQEGKGKLLQKRHNNQRVHTRHYHRIPQTLRWKNNYLPMK